MIRVTLDKRREIRRPAEGGVRITFANPELREVHGRLVDVSDCGFRMAHDFTTLATGQVVEFRHVASTGQARVIWNRVVADRVESGFLVL